jgi:hypothetical protein
VLIEQSTQPETGVTVLLVSVIILCYNAEKWTAEAIESAVAQMHRPIEIIVVDGDDTDTSLSCSRIILEYAGIVYASCQYHCAQICTALSLLANGILPDCENV